VAVLLTKDDARLAVCGFSTHVAGPILVFVALGLYAVQRLDLGVYHRMLRGAVAFNEDLEESFIKPRIMKTKKGLTQAISLYSRYPESTNLLQAGPKQSAAERVGRFYQISIVVLLALSILISVARGQKDSAPPSRVTDAGVIDAGAPSRTK